MVKSLYCGVFNFKRERYIEYVYAYTPLQAKMIIMRRIANKQGVPLSWVCNYFNGAKDNFKIEPETIFEEVKDEGDLGENIKIS